MMNPGPSTNKLPPEPRLCLTNGVVYTTTIQDFQNEVERIENNQDVFCQQICLGDPNWYPFSITVYIEGSNRETVTFSLNNLSGLKHKVKAIITAGKIEGEIEGDIIPSMRGSGVSLNKSDLVKYELNDKGELEIKIIVTEFVTQQSEADKPRSKSPVEEITSNIYQKMTYTDFVLSCGGEDIKCHRVFLATASRVLDREIERLSDVGRMELDCSATVGRELVRFIYTHHVEDEYLRREPDSFIQLGEKLGILALVDLAMSVKYESLGAVHRVVAINGNFIEFPFDNVLQPSTWK